MVQILKHLGISKWYDLDGHSLGTLEERRKIIPGLTSILIEINTLVPRYWTFLR